MSDARVRELARLAAAGDAAARRAYLVDLGRRDPELIELERRLGALLGQVRDEANRLLAPYLRTPSEYHAVFRIPVRDQSCPPLELPSLIEVIAGALEPRAGCSLGWAHGRLFPRWPVVLALAVGGPERLVVAVRPCRHQQPRVDLTWAPQLPAFADEDAPPRNERWLQAWLAADVPDRLEVPVEVARLAVEVVRARLDPRPAPRRRRPADRTRPTRAQLTRIAALREEKGLSDEAAFAGLLRDEGWLEPFERITRAWAAVVIDALGAHQLAPPPPPAKRRRRADQPSARRR